MDGDMVTSAAVLRHSDVVAAGLDYRTDSSEGRGKKREEERGERGERTQEETDTSACICICIVCGGEKY